MLTKPWNLYVFRHSALTEKSQFLTEAVLRFHAGWTMSSKMPQVYIHLSNEPSKILLQKRGIIKAEEKQTSSLQSKSCPNCNEPNKPDSRFCFKCKMVLTFDSYNETLEREKEKDNDIEELKESVAFLADRFNVFLIGQPGNKILYDDENSIGSGRIVKGIELKSELNNKAVGTIISTSSSTIGNKKK